MSTITESVDVYVPVSTACTQWIQFEEFPQFMEIVDRIGQLDDTHTSCRISVAGISREFDARITKQHGDERVASTFDDGLRHDGVITFHRLDDTTIRVTAQMVVDPEGFIENVADNADVLDRRIKGDMQRFKQFIEGRDREIGLWRGDVDRARAMSESSCVAAALA